MNDSKKRQIISDNKKLYPQMEEKTWSRLACKGIATVDDNNNNYCQSLSWYIET